MRRSRSLVTLIIVSMMVLGGCTTQRLASHRSSTKSPSPSAKQTTTISSADEGVTTLETVTADVLDQVQESVLQTPRVTVPYQAIPVPGEAIGTWSGISAQADSVEFTISADGTIHTLSEYNRGTDNVRVEETTATITSLFEVAPHVYFIDRYNGSYEALLPGITGLGGLGGNVYFGFTLEKGSYVPITWTVSDGEVLDYTKWTSFGNTAAYTPGELSNEDKQAREESRINSKF